MSPRFHFFLLFQVLLFGGSCSYSYKQTQYHIQTDKGPDRFFRYQTLNGQYRREKVYDDGTVVGTYGWVGPDNLLRLFDYIADNAGYRIVRERTLKMGPDNQHPVSNAIPSDRNKFSAAKIKPALPHKFNGNVLPSGNTAFSYPSTEPSILPTASSVLENTPAVLTPSPPEKNTRPKLRPLFVKRKKPSSGFSNRRRQNYVSTRQRIRNNQQIQNQNQQTQFSQQNDQQTPIKQQQNNQLLKPLRTQKPYQRVSSVSNSLLSTNSFTSTKEAKTSSLANFNYEPVDYRIVPDPKIAQPMEKFGYDDPGGKETINFDLGNQYRKEKVFPDGTVVGEHGYVDPMGILRITTYTSGPHGQKEAKKSYWVGRRSPAGLK